jgi:hypothetical protein
MWKETVNRLDSLARSAREGKCVDEAANFARWLEFSGYPKVFDGSPQPFPLLVDGAVVRQKIKDVLDECERFYHGGRVEPQYAQGDIVEIKHTLKLIVEHLGLKLSPPIEHTANVGSPALSVIEGGVSSLSVSSL